LPLGANFSVETKLGRSSNGVLPYFNLHTGKGGFIGAIGWTGGWKATFARDSEGFISVIAGLIKTNLTLHPGEEIRTPRIVILPWEGEAIHGHNMLRSFTLAHHSPMRNGELAKVPTCDGVWGENTIENQLAKIAWWKEKGLKIDCFWIDAGWYGNGQYQEDSTVSNSDWPHQVGNWWPRKACYPNGLKPIGDAAKKAGMDFLLWVEPERCFSGTYFCTDHPDWLYGYGDKEEEKADGSWLLNLGNPAARQYVTDLISDIISEAGLTWYRQDFNIDPGRFWEDADAPDRVGMSEIRHIEGLYKMWDDLRERHPGLMIDNCSSGGRRIDLETNSRSIPLWRSDYQCCPNFDAIGMQGQTQGLGMWVPLSGGNCDRPDDYCFRSALGQGISLTLTVNSPYPIPDSCADWMRKMLEQFEIVRDCCIGDFYPLISFSLEKVVWAAWQFDRPDEGDGVIAAFRRQESPFPKMEAILKGLQPETKYDFKDLDTGLVCTYSGLELMADGLEITIPKMPGSVLIYYKKQ
jgi:alpha-galactosidase